MRGDEKGRSGEDGEGGREGDKEGRAGKGRKAKGRGKCLHKFSLNYGLCPLALRCTFSVEGYVLYSTVK